MPDTSEELITISEGDLVESLALAMSAENLDDDTCNNVIATLLDAITNNCDSLSSDDETATAAFNFPSDSIEAQRWI
jgi:hypothetical protein